MPDYNPVHTLILKAEDVSSYASAGLSEGAERRAKQQQIQCECPVSVMLAALQDNKRAAPTFI